MGASVAYFTGFASLLFSRADVTQYLRRFWSFLKRDNATACVTHPEAARICVEIDVSKPLQNSCWLGTPGELSHSQEVIFESVPSFCVCCKKHGHLENTCCRHNKSQNKAKQVVVQ